MHGIGILMLAAVGGYWVLERSVGQRGQVKQVGQVLGVIIIAMSLAGMACWVWCMASGKGCGMGMHGKMYKGGMCPLMGSGAPAP
jgi:hypothetical protein